MLFVLMIWLFVPQFHRVPWLVVQLVDSTGCHTPIDVSSSWYKITRSHEIGTMLAYGNKTDIVSTRHRTTRPGKAHAHTCRKCTHARAIRRASVVSCTRPSYPSTGISYVIDVYPGHCEQTESQVSSPSHLPRSHHRELTRIFRIILPRESTFRSWKVYESFPLSRTLAIASPRVIPERKPPLRRNLTATVLLMRIDAPRPRLRADTDECLRRRERPGVHGATDPAVSS